MHLLNLGVLAHVDAGKTTLTERLLFDAGVLAAPGSVDSGTTVTDTMTLERRRGITIRTAVASFSVNDTVVNVIDTPGHPDFIAEVDRALAVLDGAVLVVSAVEGVQSQTVVLWRALRRLQVPALLFVNKVDRGGADPLRVLGEIRARLEPRAVSLTEVIDPGSTNACVHALDVRGEGVVEQLAEFDDRMLRLWAEGRAPSRQDAIRTVRRLVARQKVAPVLAGSALTGAGVEHLTGALTRYLPRARQDELQRPAGVVFKIDHDDRGKHVFVRMRSGSVSVRDRLTLSGRAEQRVTELRVSGPGGLERARIARAGQIAVLDGLQTARIGDTFGAARTAGEASFAPAMEEAVVEPCHPAQRGALFAALAELADQDPLIALRSDDIDREIRVSLYGEVQKEVIGALLTEDYGVPVVFRETTIVCVERVVGSGASVDRIEEGDNPYLATVGLHVASAPPGSGVRFGLSVERGSMPPAFFAATEQGVRSALRQGLHGWVIEDCVVTMTHSGYYPRQSHMHQQFNKAMSSVASDFRSLAPVVLMAALREAGTQVCEPIHRFELDVPTPTLGPVSSALARAGGAVITSDQGDRFTELTGTIPATRIRALSGQLAELTHGEGVLTTELDRYRPVSGPPPTRPRRGPDPADRELWFRAMPR
jgi:ribosomal protection tetracycline resistance protein